MVHSGLRESAEGFSAQARAVRGEVQNSECAGSCLDDHVAYRTIGFDRLPPLSPPLCNAGLPRQVQGSIIASSISGHLRLSLVYIWHCFVFGHSWDCFVCHLSSPVVSVTLGASLTSSSLPPPPQLGTSCLSINRLWRTTLQLRRRLLSPLP